MVGDHTDFLKRRLRLCWERIGQKLAVWLEAICQVNQRLFLFLEFFEANAGLQETVVTPVEFVYFVLHTAVAAAMSTRRILGRLAGIRRVALSYPVLIPSEHWLASIGVAVEAVTVRQTSVAIVELGLLPVLVTGGVGSGL